MFAEASDGILGIGQLSPRRVVDSSPNVPFYSARFVQHV